MNCEGSSLRSLADLELRQQNSDPLDGYRRWLIAGSGGSRRYLAEAVVIVGSILLAFGIDAAWDARGAKEAQAELLAAIQVDMRTNLEALDRYLGRMDQRAGETDSFLESTASELAELAPDTAAGLLGLFLGSGTFTPLDGALRTSDLSSIEDSDLRTDLGAWLRLAEDAAEDHPILETGARELALASGVAGGPRAFRGAALFPEVGSASEVLSQLRGEPGFIDALLIHDGKRRRNIGKLVELREATRGLLDRLEARQP